MVFAESTNSMEIQKLNREERTKVFDQKTFERQLTDFNSETAKKPSSEVLLVIGQQPRNDRSKYLMYVTVASSRASSQLVSGLLQVYSRSVCGFELIRFKTVSRSILQKRLFHYKINVKITNKFHPNKPYCSVICSPFHLCKIIA